MSGIDANTLLVGNQAFVLIDGNAAFTAAGQVKYAGGILYGDVNGDAVADFEIALNVAIGDGSGYCALKASDP